MVPPGEQSAISNQQSAISFFPIGEMTADINHGGLIEGACHAPLQESRQRQPKS
jgi:hypothetical protein